MGKLPQSPFEVRLAATLFLLLLGVADVFGALEVRNFASFTPAGTAATVAPQEAHAMAMCAACGTMAMEHPVDLASLDQPRHKIDRNLLVQDTHVHVPVYAITAALLSLLVFGLRLRSRTRSALVLAAFAAPFFDMAGLWGAHLAPRAGVLFGGLTVAGGFAMGLVYLFVLALTLKQCWWRRPQGGLDAIGQTLATDATSTHATDAAEATRA
jgi:hypothetical protein